MNRLWAPWRMAYVGASEPPGRCIFCDALIHPDAPNRFVIYRGERSFLMLNLYPYASGHLMAVVNRHVGTIVEATVEELADAMSLVQRAVVALTAEYRPHAFNIGINQGAAGGAGIVDHLHIHVVPRWTGDTNFMTTIGEVRVLPESLEQTFARVRSRLGG